jgi:ribosomal protein S18 acetylase RimI-like enzyme
MIQEAASEIGTLAPGDRAGFDALLAIYQRSIEPSEQKSASEIAGIVADPRYSVLVLRANGEVRGLAISCFFAADFWLLEYLAVDDTLRSRGHGRALFLAAMHAADERYPRAPCVLEVDQHAPVATPGNDRARRLQFYRALGCRRIEGLDYILPLTANGMPPPMTILVHGLDGCDTLPKGRLARWLRTIYPVVYAQAAEDPRIGQMLSPLPDDVALVSL